MSTCASTPTPGSSRPIVAYETGGGAEARASAVSRGGHPAREHGRHGGAAAEGPDTDRHGRGTVHQIPVSAVADGRRGRHHSAGHLPGRRNPGAEEDRRHRRIALCGGGAAQPARPAGHAGEYSLRRLARRTSSFWNTTRTTNRPARTWSRATRSWCKDGYLAIPDKPGWGYEMDEEAFKRMPPKPWHRAFAFAAGRRTGFHLDRIRNLTAPCGRDQASRRGAAHVNAPFGCLAQMPTLL